MFLSFLHVDAQNCYASFISVVKDYTVTFSSNISGYQKKPDFYWNFGDGKYSNLANPVHAYTNAGYYKIGLYVTDGICSDLFVDSIYISVNSPGCKAAISAEVRGDTVQFCNVSTGDDTTVNWMWDFGDGGFSSIQDPVHVYGKCGIKKVILKMTGQQCNDSVEEQIYIQPRKSCSAKFTYNISNDTVFFQELSQNNHVVRYWNFGDHGTSTSCNPHHVYARNGNYMVCLQLYDTLTGYKDLWCDTLQITSIPCAHAHFTETTAGNKVSFYNLSGSNITNSLWLFGDGNYSTSRAPEHIYKAPGDYVVKLFVTDSVYLCSDSFEKVVHIQKFEETFSISGRVLFGNQCADRGKVFLVRSDSSGKVALAVDTFSLTPADSGKYIFNKVRKGYYTLKALPSGMSSFSGSCMPGYITGEYLWADITPIYINFDFIEADMMLMPMKFMAGTAFISGEVRQGSDSMWSKPGTALCGRPISVFDQNGMPTGTAFSDSIGKFSIRLPGEGIYTLYIDIPGKRCSPLRFEITTEQLHVDHLVMYETHSSTFPSLSNLGMSPAPPALCQVFPNPFSSIILLKNPGKQKLEVSDFQGRVIYEVQPNAEVLEIDGSAWPDGIYIFRHGDHRVRVVKIR